MLRMLRKHWFLVGIVTVISLAQQAPSIGAKHGPLVPQITVKYIAVSLIFFNSGLSLKSEEIARTVSHLRLHFYIQIFTLALIPVMSYGLVLLLHDSGINQWLLKGLVVVGCMPPPVSSAVILTKTVGGNVAAAIFNSALGSFLGIFVTPVLLLNFLGVESSVSASTIVRQLCLTVVAPLVLGQSLRRRSYLVRRLTTNIPFSSINSAILLLIIYTTFCDTFLRKDVDVSGKSFLAIVVLVVFMQLCLLGLTFCLSSLPELGFSAQDIAACVYCSTHKSLTLGMPILKVMFGHHARLSVISLPLLVYHPCQILLGGLLAPLLRGWVSGTEEYRKCCFRLHRVTCMV